MPTLGMSSATTGEPRAIGGLSGGAMPPTCPTSAWNRVYRMVCVRASCTPDSPYRYAAKPSTNTASSSRPIPMPRSSDCWVRAGPGPAGAGAGAGSAAAAQVSAGAASAELPARGAALPAGAGSAPAAAGSAPGAAGVSGPAPGSVPVSASSVSAMRLLAPPQPDRQGGRHHDRRHDTGAVSTPSAVWLEESEARLTTVPVTGPVLPVPSEPVELPPGPVAPVAPLPLPLPPEPPETGLPFLTTQFSGSPSLSHGQGCGAFTRIVSWPLLLNVGLGQSSWMLIPEACPGIWLACSSPPSTSL